MDPQPDKNDLVVLAMHDQNRHRDLFQIFGEVGLRERDDAVIARLGAAHHALAPPIPNDRLDRFHARTIETVERAGWQIVIELGRVAASWAWRSSNTDLGRPNGLAGVFTISGGTALMIAAFATF